MSGSKRTKELASSLQILSIVAVSSSVSFYRKNIESVALPTIYQYIAPTKEKQKK